MNNCNENNYSSTTKPYINPKEVEQMMNWHSGDMLRLLKEVQRLQAVEQAIQEYGGPGSGDRAGDLIAWLESTTGYISEPYGVEN